MPWTSGPAGGYRDLVRDDCEAVLPNDRAGQMWKGMDMEPTSLGSTRSAAPGFGCSVFYRVDIQCDMLNLSWDGQ